MQCVVCDVCTGLDFKAAEAIEAVEEGIQKGGITKR